MTVVLVFSPTCTHCRTYMPLWDKMCALKDKQSNMVRVQSSVYNSTPLASKKSVQSVPTVLFVASDGTIEEATQPRNELAMTNAVQMGVTDSASVSVRNTNRGRSDTVSSNANANVNVNLNRSLNVNVNTRGSMTQTQNQGSNTNTTNKNLFTSENITTVLPGTVIQPNPLHPLPGTVIASPTLPSGAMNTMRGGRRNRTQRQHQRGGNPIATAALTAAGPLALLMGAYSALPARKNHRSSGLGRPIRSRSLRRQR